MDLHFHLEMFRSGRPKGESKLMAEVTRMTQTQIIRELAEEAQVPTKTVKQILSTFAEMAVRETKKKGLFVVPGLGRLVRQERKARTGRNPATGEAIKIPAKKVVKFRIAKAVKDAIVPAKAAKK
jgi:DNA-binding protein HU-beta